MVGRGGGMKPGDLVTNLGLHSRSKLFSSPLCIGDSPRYTTGLLIGVGIVLEQHGSDVRVMCGGITGWCYGGNLKVISEAR